MLNLDQEVRLWSSNADREKYENLATLYGIIVSLDHLERAYIRDTIRADAYTPECSKLLAQYKTTLKLLGEAVPSIDAFVSEYRLDCSAAVPRLKIGIPATVEHSAEQSVESAKFIAETTQNFITLMDALKLKLKAKDQLHPILSELMSSYSRFQGSNEWEGRSKILQWLITLNQRSAHQELSDEESREMFFDVQAAYNSFFERLSRS